MAARPHLVFVHGAGRAGRAAWPEQQEAFPDAAYLTLSGFGDDEPAVPDIGAWAAQILGACGEGAHVVAHSYGGIPVVAAAADAAGMVRSLILFEPALHSLARGAEHVEDHVARMSPVIAAAPRLTAAEFGLAWSRAIGVPAPTAPTTAAELRGAERLRLLPAPWDIPAPASVFAEIPTLVVTGGWNEEYEEIASALVQAGATSRRLTGFGHRVQDHPAADALIREWVERLEKR
jgi:pimeloyl-ACP methyl ester carboxylesterase